MSTTTIKTPAPMRVTQDEAARVCRLSPGSSPCERAREAAMEWEQWLAESQRENAVIRKAREARQAEAAALAADAQEAERARDEAEMREDIRRRFFAANSSASAADYERLADRLYDDELMRRATEGRDAEKRALLSRGDYGL